MKSFVPTHREYIAPSDLSIMNDTYNTLQTGHQEAVKAKSALSSALANLPLHESEYAYRQQKLNEIEKVISDNTIEGNSYAALDNIIEFTGNIQNDQGLINRINSNKSYQDYTNKLNNRTDISDETKEYYRERNSYYNKDIVNDTTGNIIGYENWQPIENETSTIPVSKIVADAIKFAAEENGTMNSFRYIDSNGNVTTDESKAVDGEIYNTVLGTFERLSEDKLQSAINGILKDPNVAASLDQDYKIALWKNNKLKSEGTYNPNIMRNGMIMSKEEFIRSQVDPIKESAVYNNLKYTSTAEDVISNIIKKNKGNIGSIVGADGLSNMGDSSIIDSDPIGEENNKINNFKSNYSKYNEILKDVSNIDLPDGTSENIYNVIDGAVKGGNEIDISKFYNNIKNSNMNPQQKISLYREIKSYNDGIISKKDYNDNITDKNDVDAINFISDIDNGGIPVEGRSSYDDKVIKGINELFPNGRDLKLAIDKEQLSLFIDSFEDGIVNKFKDSGLTIKEGNIVIPNNKKEQVIKVFKLLSDLDIDIKKYNDNVDRGIFTPSSEYGVGGYKAMERLILRQYNKADKRRKELYNKYGVAADKVISTSVNLSGESFNDINLRELLKTGKIDQKTYDKLSGFDKEDIKKLLTLGSYSNYNIYVDEEGNKVRSKISKSEDRNILGNAIATAIQSGNKNITYSPAIQAGKFGFNVIITGEDSTISDALKGNNTIKSIFIETGVNDEIGKAIANDPYVQSVNVINKLGQIKDTEILLDVNNSQYLGQAAVKSLPNETGYRINLGKITNVVDSKSAAIYRTALLQYEEFKNSIMMGAVNKDSSNAKLYLNNLINTTIAQLNLNEEQEDIVRNKFINEINTL